MDTQSDDINKGLSKFNWPDVDEFQESLNNSEVQNKSEWENRIRNDDPTLDDNVVDLMANVVSKCFAVHDLMIENLPYQIAEEDRSKMNMTYTTIDFPNKRMAGYTKPSYKFEGTPISLEDLKNLEEQDAQHLEITNIEVGIYFQALKASVIEFIEEMQTYEDFEPEEKMRIFQNRFQEIEVHYMAAVVHETAHGLFFLSAISNLKKRQFIINEAKSSIDTESMDVDEMSLSEYEAMNEIYFSNSKENSARLWEYGFLMKYFPKSLEVVNLKLDFKEIKKIGEKRLTKGD